MSTMSSSEARAGLPQILDRVAEGEEVTITRHGLPVAVVVRPDVLRLRRADAALADAEELRELMEQARSRPLPPEGSISSARGQELLDDLSRHRDAR